MIDAIEEIDAHEPRLGLAPVPLATASVYLWASVFAAVYATASSMIALMYAEPPSGPPHNG